MIIFTVVVMFSVHNLYYAQAIVESLFNPFAFKSFSLLLYLLGQQLHFNENWKRSRARVSPTHLLLFFALRSHAPTVCFISPGKMARFHPLLLVVACAAAVVPSLAVPDLYRFGEGNGDTLLFPNDDGSSAAVSLRLPFPFFDEEHSQLFVRKPASSCRTYTEHVWLCAVCCAFASLLITI